ncbi:N-glycosylase/DNA lyase [Lachnospiraceae bacterium C7]|nr:N-glycosylase/DNA lyase [Lachnospiraceae bacterium C7]
MNTINIDAEFDLKKIENSGEVFRFIEVENHPGLFRVVAFKKALYIRKSENNSNEYEISCSKEEFDTLWKKYFDLNTDYKKIREMIKEDDEFLYNAAKYSKGVRILQQDPWEMIISFVISQRKNIPAIKKAVETLCQCAGTPIEVDLSQMGIKEKQVLYGFPTPEQMHNMTDEDWKRCALGYREKYLKKIVEEFYRKEVTVEYLETLSDEDLYTRLNEFYGIGPKVSQCVMLFGFHRLDSFPKDVWILRILEEKYNNNFDFERYRPYNGVMQQFMFYGSLELGRKV